jgi:adenylate cyclase
MKEIERKFSIKDRSALPSLDKCKKLEILQAYIFCDLGHVDGISARVRRQESDDGNGVNIEHFLTLKRGDGIEREENEMVISPDYFRELAEHNFGYLEKTRYLYPFNRRTIEIDFFKGHQEGRILAEIEFPTVDIAERFKPPKWIGREVTGNPKYSNKNLVATDSFLRDWLRDNYGRLKSETERIRELNNPNSKIKPKSIYDYYFK